MENPAATPSRQTTVQVATGGTACRRVWGVALGVALLVVGLTFARTKDYGLLGFDSYPIIIASRIQSWSDVLGNFTEKLMDGRYSGDFYRPLVNALFALDYAVWKLDPRGYQLTNALLFGGCALALFGLARRLVGGGAVAAPLVAMLYFALHPAQFEVVPVPPRRADLLCGLFAALSLACQLAPRALARRWPPLVPGVLALLAMAAKESGLVLPGLAFFAVLLYSPRRGAGARTRHALLASLPQVVAAGVMVAARLGVLGGLGGHADASWRESIGRLPGVVATVGRLVVFPQPVMQASSVARWCAIAAAAGLTCLTLLTIGRRWAGRDRPARQELCSGLRRVGAAGQTGENVAGRSRRPLRTGLLAVVWVVLFAAAHAGAGRIEVWYLFLPVAGMALLAGAAAEAALELLRASVTAVRGGALAALVPVIALAGWHVGYCPFLQRYDEYERATAAGRAFLDQLRQRIGAAADGTKVWAPPLPAWTSPQPDRPTLVGVAILAGYSVQAWAELEFPGRRIRVATDAGTALGRPAPDEVVIVLTTIQPGFDGAPPR